jgi:hypothetical protein
MQKTLVALVLGMSTFGLVTFGSAAPAEAQELGTKGDAIFGAERVFGIRGERLTIDNPAPQNDTDITTTTISLGFARTTVPYNLPRIAFDYLIIDKLSLGGALLYSSMDAEQEGGGDVGITDFELSPRVGYLHMFGRVVGIWPRGGLSYHSTSSQEGGDFDAWTVAFNAECMFPIVVRGHFGFLVGLAFDQSLVGNYDPDNGGDRDIMMRTIGLQAGLFGWI